jgi:ABC-type polysaccharide/polyol phosphate transport system ATPase subunit
MKGEIAIEVINLSKSFRLPHDNRYTLKQKLLYFAKQNSYETFTVLNDISFSINKGDFFGIIGRNGTGKSTLLKILAGIYSPDKGKVITNGEISPFLELGVGFSPDLSGRDNIFLNGIILGLTKKEIKRKFDEIVAFSELEKFIDQKLRNYSSGMFVRLAFSIAIFANKEILLMDEVLAVGDIYFKEKCLNELNKLKQAGRTIIFISHDMKTIQEHCTKAMLLRKGKIAAFGDPITVIGTYTAK